MAQELSKKNVIEIEDLMMDSPMQIPVVENNIYFYSPVDERSVANLAKEIKILENRLLYEKYSRGQDFISPINLYIMSDGGEGIAGFSAADTILNCKAPVHTIISGSCSSSATFLSLAGKKRYITRYSTVLIHQLSKENGGTYYQLKDDIKNLDLYMDMIRQFYRKYTKIPSKKLNDILKHDVAWNAETCLKYGIVDEIL